MSTYPAFVPYPFEAQRYAAQMPLCTDGVEDQRHRVLIIGGGPVGLATALGLAQQGVASVVIEADDSVCFGSRAICVSRRSLEILHRLGVGESFDAIGLPWTGGRSFYQGQEVLRFQMPQDDNQQFAPMVNMDTGASINSATCRSCWARSERPLPWWHATNSCSGCR